MCNVEFLCNTKSQYKEHHQSMTMFIVTKIHFSTNQIILSIYFKVLMEQNLANKTLSYVWWNDILAFRTPWKHRESWSVFSKWNGIGSILNNYIFKFSNLCYCGVMWRNRHGYKQNVSKTFFNPNDAQLACSKRMSKFKLNLH